MEENESKWFARWFGIFTNLFAFCVLSYTNYVVNYWSVVFWIPSRHAILRMRATTTRSDIIAGTNFFFSVSLSLSSRHSSRISLFCCFEYRVKGKLHVTKSEIFKTNKFERHSWRFYIFPFSFVFCSKMDESQLRQNICIIISIFSFYFNINISFYIKT